MKVLILLAVVATVRCTVIPVAPAVAVVPAIAETGESAQFRSEDNLGNYNFGYNEDHTSGGTFRREVGDAYGNVAGSYGLRDADGRVRIVNYIANDDGFKADIKTNEPGVEPKDPADASINKAESVLVETHAAPLLAAPVVQGAHVEQVRVEAPVAYTFPEPASVPVAKTVTTITKSEPVVHHNVAYSFPPAAPVPVAKTVTTVAKTEPVVHNVAYSFPPAAAVPVAKTVGAPITYTFPEPAPAPVAKAVTTFTKSEPIAYAVQEPVVVPATKSVTTVTKQEPAAYAFPEPAVVSVAKTVSAPHVSVAEPAVAYTFPAHTVVPKSHVAVAPAANLAYSSDVRLESVPRARYAYSLPYGYAYNYNPYFYGNGYRYNVPHYSSLYSPVVSSFAGPVPYFNHIQYPGYTLLKK